MKIFSLSKIDQSNVKKQDGNVKVQQKKMKELKKIRELDFLDCGLDGEVERRLGKRIGQTEHQIFKLRV